MWDLLLHSFFPQLFRVGWELFDNDTDMMLHWQLGKKLASGGVQESTTHFRILSGPRNYIRKLVEAAAAAGKFSMWAFPFLLISFRVPSLIFPGRFFFRWFAFRFRALFLGGQCKRRSKLSFKQHVCKNHAPGYSRIPIPIPPLGLPSSWLLSLAVATFYSSPPLGLFFILFPYFFFVCISIWRMEIVFCVCLLQ